MDNDLHKPAIGLPSTLSSTKEAIEARIAAGPPTSAEDYLLRVRLEAESMPNVFTATPEQISRGKGRGGPNRQRETAKSSTGMLGAPPRKQSSEQQRSWIPTSEGFEISKELEIVPCPEELRPSAVWETGQLKNFVDLRQYLQFWAAHWRTGTLGEAARHEGSAAPFEDVKPLPRRSDEEAWMLKCVGSYWESGNAAQFLRGDTPNGDAQSSATAPIVSLLIRCDNITCEKLIEYHIRALCELASSQSTSFVLTSTRAAWIYGLFALIDVPLSPRIACSIRELLRHLCAARARRQPGAEDLGRLNLILLLAERYFGQGKVPAPVAL